MSKIKSFLFIIISLLGAAAVSFAAPGVIRAGDTISVWVKGEPELSVEKQVGRDGSILLPLIGSVGVNGLKTTDAARMISSMLEDGFLRDPLVQVSIKSSSAPAARTQTKARNRKAAVPYSQPVPQPAAPAATAQPLYSESEPDAGSIRQTLIEVVDAVSYEGIGGVAMMLGNRIYQSNRLGQILLDVTSGHAVIIADGFQTVSGRLESMLQPGNPAKIQLNSVKFAESITFTVVDAGSRRPISGVEVVLDEMKVKTNRHGSFKVTSIKKEFGEITLRRRGYRPHRQVVDYKGPENQTIMMVKQ